MSLIDQPAIPKGSLVLVIGANGFIGSNISDQLLKLGYKVRGTTRNPAKNTWITSLFDCKYGAGNFELVSVPDMEVPNAFDEAVRGVSAVVHTATNFTMSPDPHAVIPGTVAGTVNAMASAMREPTVRRFVLTSSSASALIPKPDTPGVVTTKTWNDEIVEFAFRDPPYEPERAYPVYAASKTLSEKEAWNFVKREKPGFVFNAVLPNINFGASLDPAGQGHPSTSGMVAELQGKSGPALTTLKLVEYFVDVQDDALLHVAAMIHPDVQSERVFAFAEPVNGDRVLAVLRKLYPGRSFPANFQSEEDLNEIVPRARAERLLRDMGKDGWTSLEESVKRNTEDIDAGCGN
ncbi:aldehyde reductase protein [Colletotrichum plurivorum]|uniref:Aldehyde reductase protein n=1 Tax=Colletotrichum plurivorum TaxID=2175906 RepID=A0A8H6K2B4_9PEZI|nr:aldehyde reductase protein [Colletotrichum plurivorum]